MIELHLIYDTHEELDEVLKQPELNEHILSRIFPIIEEAILNNKKKIYLIHIVNLGLFVEIESKNYKTLLNNILQYYINLEDFETCSKITNLISKK